MLAGIVVALLVVALLAYVMWVLRDRDETQDDEVHFDDILGDNTHIVRNGQEEVEDEPDPSLLVSTPWQRQRGSYEVAIASLRATGLRRLSLIVVVLIVIGIVTRVIVSSTTSPVWLAVVPVILVVWALASHASYVLFNRHLDARLAALNQGDQEITRVITAEELRQAAARAGHGQPVDGPNEMSIDLDKPIDGLALSDPLPFAPRTYVNQPQMPRTVRTIDLSTPGDGSRFPVSTSEHQDRLPFEDGATGRASGQ